MARLVPENLMVGGPQAENHWRSDGQEQKKKGLIGGRAGVVLTCWFLIPTIPVVVRSHGGQSSFIKGLE